MKYRLLLLALLLGFTTRVFCQTDSILNERSKAIMIMSILIDRYDSSCIQQYYSSIDSATNANLESGIDFKILSSDMYFDRKLFSGDSAGTETWKIEFQDAENMVYVDNVDSSITLYNKRDNINITGFPLLDSLYTLAFLNDIFITAADSPYNKLTVLFKPGQTCKRMEIVYNKNDFEIANIQYFSDETRFANEEDSVGVDYVLVRRYFFARSTPEEIGLARDYFNQSWYFIKSGELYLPTSNYTGYSVNTVF